MEAAGREQRPEGRRRTTSRCFRRMDGKRRKGKISKGKMPKIKMSKTKIIQMSIDRNVENESVLKYKCPSPSPSILHVHLHLPFLFSTFSFSTVFLSIFFLSAFSHHTLPQLSMRYASEKNLKKSRMFSKATQPIFRSIRNFNITQIFQRDCKINL